MHYINIKKIFPPISHWVHTEPTMYMDRSPWPEKLRLFSVSWRCWQTELQSGMHIRRQSSMHEDRPQWTRGRRRCVVVWLMKRQVFGRLSKKAQQNLHVQTRPITRSSRTTRSKTLCYWLLDIFITAFKFCRAPPGGEALQQLDWQNWIELVRRWSEPDGLVLFYRPTKTLHCLSQSSSFVDGSC